MDTVIIIVRDGSPNPTSRVSSRNTSKSANKEITNELERIIDRCSLAKAVEMNAFSPTKIILHDGREFDLIAHSMAANENDNELRALSWKQLLGKLPLGQRIQMEHKLTVTRRTRASILDDNTGYPVHIGDYVHVETKHTGRIGRLVAISKQFIQVESGGVVETFGAEDDFRITLMCEDTSVDFILEYKSGKDSVFALGLEYVKVKSI